MGPAASQPILAHLREKLAEIDPHLGPALPEEHPPAPACRSGRCVAGRRARLRRAA